MKIFHLNAPGPYYTNSFLLLSEAGHAVIIDAAADPQLYLDALKENGATLTAILQTHGHHDHVGSIDALRKATGAKMYMARPDAAQFRLSPDEFFADGETLHFDELAFRIITTPGHTPGSVCIRCGDFLFTGDTLFCGDIGRTDLEGGSYTEIQSSLKKLCAAVTDDPQVLPGHDIFSRMEQEKRTNRYLR